MSRGKGLGYLENQGVNVEGLGNQKHSGKVIGDKHSENEGHKSMIWSSGSERLAMCW